MAPRSRKFRRFALLSVVLAAGAGAAGGIAPSRTLASAQVTKPECANLPISSEQFTPRSCAITPTGIVAAGGASHGDDGEVFTVGDDVRILATYSATGMLSLGSRSGSALCVTDAMGDETAVDPISLSTTGRAQAACPGRRALTPSRTDYGLGLAPSNASLANTSRVGPSSTTPPADGMAAMRGTAFRPTLTVAGGPQASYSYYIGASNLSKCSGTQTSTCPVWTMGGDTWVPPNGAWVVLDFGAPCQDPVTGVSGTQMFGEYVCTPASLEQHLVSRWIAGFEVSHDAKTPRVILAAGLSNSVNGVPNDWQTPQEMAAIGGAWFSDVVGATPTGSVPTPLTIWGAIDAEESSDGNWLGPTPTRAFVDAFGVAAGHSSGGFRCDATNSGMLADFGDAVYLQGRWNPSGGWTVADIYHVSFGASVACAVPEIYYDINAQEWQSVSTWATQQGYQPITFTAAMSENGAGGTLAAADSWSSLETWTGQWVPFLTNIAWSLTLAPALVNTPAISAAAWVDANGDGKADYCRRVGTANLVDSGLACTVATTNGFGTTLTSGVLDWGHDAGLAWVDADGDGTADYCRRVGSVNLVDSKIACTLSTGTGFGPTITSDVLDWGYDAESAWVDVNGDGKADYCRRVGGTNLVSSYVSCTLSTGTGFGATITSTMVDWGYDAGAGWVDVNGDGKADYCRRVGGVNMVSSYVACTLSTGTGFGATVMSSVTDWGYDAGATWARVTGNGTAAYCRRVGGANMVSSYIACTPFAGSGFGQPFLSGVVDWGYKAGVGWADVNGDGREDYCRRVGGTNFQSSYVACVLSTGFGFSGSVTSGVIDWGWDSGSAWVDANGDHMADYCRRVGSINLQSSYVSCTVSTGSGFGASLLSSVIDWGHGL